MNDLKHLANQIISGRRLGRNDDLGFMVTCGLDGLCDFEHISVDKLCAQYFKDRFAEAERISKERDVPVYCGEYGVIELASAQDTLNWYKDICTAFDKYGFGRAAWCYKQMDFGISDKHLDSVREELLRYL